MKKTMNIDSAFVCHCARIRHSELLEIFEESAEPSYDNFKRQYGIGDQCASCEYEVKAVLDEYRGSRGLDVVAAPRATLGQIIAEKRRSFLRWIERHRATPVINSRACMFFIHTEELRSTIIVSNVNNPESNINPNHGAVFFQISIYDGGGALIQKSGRLKVRANETCELFAEDIFDVPPVNLIGSAYVEYFDLEATNTLRPYCALNYFGGDGKLRSRQHYHDKFYSGIIPGFVQCPSALMPDRECWLAMVNCGEQDFEATFYLRQEDDLRTATHHFGPRQSAFLSIPKLFGTEVAKQPVNAHFWIESGPYVMTYFFWHDLPTDVWIGQHH